ncbi:MAG: GNAT family N-acetyltransferase [Pseudomonadota bacterium]
MGARTLDGARAGLPKTLHAVTARTGNRLLAMGRVVGDGGTSVQLVDVAVHPDAQGQGLGSEITRRLVAWCEARLPPTCHISLVASDRAAPLYQSHGFRPCRGLDRYADPASPPP